MLNTHITQTKVANFPFPLKISHRPKGLGKGYIGIIIVAEVNQIEMIQAQALQIGFTGFTDAFGAQITLPTFIIAAFPAQFTDDDQSFWIRIKCFGD